MTMVDVADNDNDKHMLTPHEVVSDQEFRLKVLEGNVTRLNDGRTDAKHFQSCIIQSLGTY